MPTFHRLGCHGRCHKRPTRPRANGSIDPLLAGRGF